MPNNYSAHDRVVYFAQREVENILQELQIPPSGIQKKDLERRRREYGTNETVYLQRDTLLQRLRRAYINPFSVVLFVLAIISFITDVLMSANPSRNYMPIIIICLMLLVSGTVRFVQELHSKKVTDRLLDIVNTSVPVLREGSWQSICANELVVGDLVRLTAGDRVPADIRLTRVRDCFVSQAVITGESAIQEKFARRLSDSPHRLADFSNTLFLGTTLVSGSCQGVVAAVGRDTVYGGISGNTTQRKNGFDRGANSIAWVLIRFMALLVPIVFVASGLTKGDWLAAFLFALSVAVGLTPELLPMVITACLARGSFNMGQKQTIVKSINAMQEFGSMDVLCVDKTGTLTGDTLLLEYYMDVLGNESLPVLDAAVLNSFYHSGVQNHLDTSILKVQDMPGHQEHFSDLLHRYHKIDELPFDDSRRFSSVLVHDGTQQLLLVKGDIHAVVSRCSSIWYQGGQYPADMEKEQSVHAVIDDMLEDGMKVLAVAAKVFSGSEYSSGDETGLTLLGYIAFFDAPKTSASGAIEELKKLHVTIKVLTGDNAAVAVSICRRLGIDTGTVITGADFDAMDDDAAQICVENACVFAELAPRQKAKITALLQSNGHTVGFLGDGMNDLPAILEADVGISVDTAAQAVKEVSDVILLKKDLHVLENGILEGRKAFANMSKYIRITASSNLGNILAIVIASIALPFFPMTSIQILLLNLLYDLICLVLPWDHVDADLCKNPLEWSGSTLSRFMLFFGPISSVFDILTFAFLFLFLCPFLCGGPYSELSSSGQLYFISLFQTGWFLESMWTQVMILQLLRTSRLPFLQSRPSRPVLCVTISGIILFTLLAMTPVGGLIGMTRLPPIYFVFLIFTVAFYLCAVTIAKRIYIQHYQKLL